MVETGYQPKVGDRVRITIEKTITAVGPWSAVPAPHVRLGAAHGLTWGVTGSDEIDLVSVKRLPDLEPAWWPPRPGDVIQAGVEPYLVHKDGNLYGVWAGTSGDVLTPAAALEWSRGGGARPFCLLVRDCKPVSAASS